jgi:hypothetical protein
MTSEKTPDKIIAFALRWQNISKQCALAESGSISVYTSGFFGGTKQNLEGENSPIPAEERYSGMSIAKCFIRTKNLPLAMATRKNDGDIPVLCPLAYGRECIRKEGPLNPNSKDLDDRLYLWWNNIKR